MPTRFRKGKSKVRPKTGLKRRFKKKRSTPLVKNLGYLFPQRLKCVMPYVENAITLSAVATPYEYVFAGNNIYDPNYTGTGHQPLYFDQLAAIYNIYYVRASSIKVELLSTSGGTLTGSQRFFIVPTIGAANLTASFSPGTILEQEHCRNRICTAAGNLQKATLKHYMTSKKMLSSPGSTSFDAQGTVSGSGPADAWYWHVLITSPDDSTAISTVWRATLYYSVEFFERKNIASS